MRTASSLFALVLFSAPSLARADEVELQRVVAIQQAKIMELEAKLPQSVTARYSTNAGAAIPSDVNSIINFEDVEFDSHNAVTTGASWQFKAPMDGKYLVSAEVTYAPDVLIPGKGRTILIFEKNGLAFLSAETPISSVGKRTSNTATTLVQFAAGDTFTVRAFQDNGGARVLDPASYRNSVSIHRVAD